MTKILIRVYMSDGNAVFEISDDGCGIDIDRLDRIFSGGFSSLGQSTDTKRRNAGIGLSVCDTIIKAHGGRISAENREEGGATFRFTLAVCDTDGKFYNEGDDLIEQ